MSDQQGQATAKLPFSSCFHGTVMLGWGRPLLTQTRAAPPHPISHHRWVPLGDPEPPGLLSHFPHQRR